MGYVALGRNPSFRGLVILNVVLLGVLAVVSIRRGGMAFAGSSSNARGEYVAVSGTISGSKTPVIWLVDQASQEVVAVQFDAQSDRMVGFGYRNMSKDAISVQKNRQ